jgi:hypothetical protein
MTEQAPQEKQMTDPVLVKAHRQSLNRLGELVDG